MNPSVRNGHEQLVVRRRPWSGRQATAGIAALCVVIALGSCRSSTTSAGQPASSGSPPPISATLPSGYAPGVTAGPPGPAGVGGATDSGVESVPTSVLPENEPFCSAVQGATRLFSGPEKGADDAAVLRRMKETFARLAELAPSMIKPEVQGMSNTIQSLGSAADINRLDDPNFTAYQERLAMFVKENCGFDLSG